MQLHIQRCYSPSLSEFVPKTSFSELVARENTCCADKTRETTLFSCVYNSHGVGQRRCICTTALRSIPDFAEVDQGYQQLAVSGQTSLIDWAK